MAALPRLMGLPSQLPELRLLRRGMLSVLLEIFDVGRVVLSGRKKDRSKGLKNDDRDKLRMALYEHDQLTLEPIHSMLLTTHRRPRYESD